MEPPLTAKEAEVKAGIVPRHVAVIMDGNGRWAKSRGLPRLAGHREGAKSVRAVARAARRIGCEVLTLYAFSAQNWQRPEDEVNGLMGLLRQYLVRERDELIENDIRIEAVGDLDRLPSNVKGPLEALRRDTAKCGSLMLVLCLSYGGREEIAAMARRIALDVRDGSLDPDQIDEEALRARMWTGEFPEADLVIRTSGEIRISNFLLWSCAYSEWVFVPAHWPDFREDGFLDAVREYQGRERRFGRVGGLEAG